MSDVLGVLFLSHAHTHALYRFLFVDFWLVASRIVTLVLVILRACVIIFVIIVALVLKWAAYMFSHSLLLHFASNAAQSVDKSFSPVGSVNYRRLVLCRYY